MPSLLRLPALLALLAGLLLLAGCSTAARRNTFTPWMRPAEFSAFLNEREAKRDDGKNFWSRGHWITAVEGRWENGAPEYRVRVGDAPADRRYWWYWWFNQSQEDFNRHLHRLSDQGFTLVHSSSFQWPDGTERFSGVWHKIEPTPPRPPDQRADGE